MLYFSCVLRISGTDGIRDHFAASFVFTEEDTPSTVVTPLPPPQTMSNSRDGEVRTGAGQSTGESLSSSCLTGQVKVDKTAQHMAGTPIIPLKTWIECVDHFEVLNRIYS